MPASLEHMLAKLHCNLRLPLNLNKGNNCRNLPQLLSMFHNNNCLRPRQVQRPVLQLSKSPNPVLLFWRQCLKRGPPCRSYKWTSPGRFRP